MQNCLCVSTFKLWLFPDNWNWQFSCSHFRVLLFCSALSTNCCCLVTELCLDSLQPHACQTSVHGISQARILERVAISFLQGICPTQGLNVGLLCWQLGSLPLSQQESPTNKLLSAKWHVWVSSFNPAFLVIWLVPKMVLRSRLSVCAFFSLHSK